MGERETGVRATPASRPLWRHRAWFPGIDPKASLASLVCENARSLTPECKSTKLSELRFHASLSDDSQDPSGRAFESQKSACSCVGGLKQSCKASGSVGEEVLVAPTGGGSSWMLPLPLWA